MTGIVERLRNLGYLGWPTCYEAADDNERLTAAVRDAHGLIDNDLVIPWIIAHKLDDVLGIQ